MRISKKALITLVVVMLLCCLMSFAACGTSATDNTGDNNNNNNNNENTTNNANASKALDLASQCKNVSVAIYKGDKIYYGFAKEEGKSETVINPYEIDIDVSDYIDLTKNIKGMLKVSDVTIGEIDYDSSSGDITLSATLKDSSATLGVSSDSATLYIDGNISNNTVREYSIEYTDKNAYDVKINLY